MSCVSQHVWSSHFREVLVIAQLFPSESAEALLQRESPLAGLDVRQRMVLAFVTNGVWLPVFNNETWTSAISSHNLLDEEILV